MKSWSMTLALAVSAFTSAVHAGALRDCTPADIGTGTMSASDAVGHRLFDVLPVTYAHHDPDRQYGLNVELLIGDDGVPVCLAKESTPFSQDKKEGPERQAYRAVMAGWRYRPFLNDGKPVRVYVDTYVPEQILPEKHIPMPDGPLFSTSVTLKRNGCYGTCQIYRVTLHGDGRVDYDGEGFVDVLGRHHYSVSPGEVAALIERLRARDIWSMQGSYSAPITDSAAYVLTVDVAGHRKVIFDYLGGMVGMPAAVTAAEKDIDDVARVDGLSALSPAGVKVLQDEHFAFASQAGADLLMRGASRDEASDDALVALIDLGAPVEGGMANGRRGEPDTSPLLNVALLHHHIALLEPLIRRGALQTAGKTDQAKIDKAFQDAIAGGRLAAVQRLWQEAGDTPHPALTFQSAAEADAPAPARTASAPVTLLLSRGYDDDGWQGFEIARWLIAQGCDPKAAAADGTTLLHIAADANDPAMVRYLLDLGADPSAPGPYGLPPLGSTLNEDVAMMLLEAGTRFDTWDGGIADFRGYAQNKGWTRVLAWLDAHPETGQ